MDKVGNGALRIRSSVTGFLTVWYWLYSNCEAHTTNSGGVRHIYALVSRVCRWETICQGTNLKSQVLNHGTGWLPLVMVESSIIKITPTPFPLHQHGANDTAQSKDGDRVHTRLSLALLKDPVRWAWWIAIEFVTLATDAIDRLYFDEEVSVGT